MQQGLVFNIISPFSIIIIIRRKVGQRKTAMAMIGKTGADPKRRSVQGMDFLSPKVTIIFVAKMHGLIVVGPAQQMDCLSPWLKKTRRFSPPVDMTGNCPRSDAKNGTSLALARDNLQWQKWLASRHGPRVSSVVSVQGVNGLPAV
jgi:hypothetical protein